MYRKNWKKRMLYIGMAFMLGFTSGVVPVCASEVEVQEEEGQSSQQEKDVSSQEEEGQQKKNLSSEKTQEAEKEPAKSDESKEESDDFQGEEMDTDMPVLRFSNGVDEEDNFYPGYVATTTNPPLKGGLSGQGTKEDPWQVGAESGDDVRAYIESKTLYITGSGKMQTYYNSAVGVLPHEWDDADVEKLQVEAGVTTTGGYAFANMASLKSAVFEGTDTVINAGAFQMCYNLESVKLPANIKKINGSTFLGCMSLTEIALPKTISYIQVSAFRFSGLKKVEIPASVRTIGSYAFQGSDLEEVTIPAKVHTVENDCFLGCSNLKKVVLEEGVTRVSDLAFGYCEQLACLTVPKTIKHISAGAFQKVDVPSLMKQIKADVDEMFKDFPMISGGRLKESTIREYTKKLTEEVTAAIKKGLPKMEVHFDGKPSAWDIIIVDTPNDALYELGVMYYQWHVESKEEFLDILAQNAKGNKFATTDFYLECDVDLKDHPFSDKSQVSGIFGGRLDGQNHTISNLKIVYSPTQNDNAALFSGLNTGAVVKNLTFENVDIGTGDHFASGKYQTLQSKTGCGTVAGYACTGSMIMNVHVKSGEINGYNSVGGLIGQINKPDGKISDEKKRDLLYDLATEGFPEADKLAARDLSQIMFICNCSNSAKINCDNTWAGGIVGRDHYNEIMIYKCKNTQQIQAKNECGGIIGYAGNTSDDPRVVISDCENNGEIYGDQAHAGGIIGACHTDNNNLVYENNTNNAYVTAKGDRCAGGIIGFLAGGGSFTNNWNYAEIYAQAGKAGGLIGQIADDKCVFKDCHHKNRNMIMAVFAGGLVGFAGSKDNDPKYEFVDCSMEGSVVATPSGGKFAGGIIGYLESDSWDHHFENITVSGRVESISNAGGVVSAFFGGGSFINISNHAEIISQEGSAGGVVGCIEDDPCTFTECKNDASITAKSQAGGICGAAGNNDKDRKHSFIQCENNGNITSSNWAGGIVGGIDTDHKEHVIRENVNNGEINGGDRVGGIVGWMEGGCPDVYKNINTGKIAASNGSAGGIIGVIENDINEFRECSSSGPVGGTAHVGYICGWDGCRRKEIDNNTASIFGNGSWIMIAGCLAIAVAIFLYARKQRALKNQVK